MSSELRGGGGEVFGPKSFQYKVILSWVTKNSGNEYTGFFFNTAEVKLVC